MDLAYSTPVQNNPGPPGGKDSLGPVYEASELSRRSSHADTTPATEFPRTGFELTAEGFGNLLAKMKAHNTQIEFGLAEELFGRPINHVSSPESAIVLAAQGGISTPNRAPVRKVPSKDA